MSTFSIDISKFNDKVDQIVGLKFGTEFDKNGKGIGRGSTIYID